MLRKRWCSTHKLLALAMVVGFAAPALASTTATITVGGSEQQISGSWDHGTITVAFNSFSETITYGQFSSAASVAAALAGMFSRDYAAQGLSAKAACPPNGTVITFTLQGTATFGSLGVSNPASSFQLSSSGFQSDAAQATPVLTWPLPDPITYGTALSSTQLNATANVPGTFSYDPPAGTVLPPGNQVLGVTFTPTDTTNYSVVTETIPLSVNSSSSGGGQTIYSYGLNYEPSGNVNGYNDSVMGSWTFNYDTLNRLAGSQGSQPGNSLTNYCWSYDAFGNRWQQMGSDQAISGGGGSLCEQQPGANVNYTWASYSSGNRMTYTVQAPAGVQYDAAGDVTNDGRNQYLYNADGQICAVQWTYNSITVMTEYIYDAEGRRVAEGSISAWSCDTANNGFTATANYVRDQAGHQLSEFTPGQDGTMAWQHTNVYANGTLIATEDNTEAHFYLNDWLGTRRVQTDYAGTVEQTCSSLPYGDDETCAPAPTENLFTGKERDSESGNDYFNARYYSSAVGRFLSPDPDTGTLLHILNPQRWNMYPYALNNPLNITDPTGKDAIAVNFVGEVPVGGHEGIIVVNRDGTATYARFGPQHASSLSDAGKVTIMGLKPVAFNSSGLPTDAAYKQLANEVGQIEGQPASTVGFNYFKTSDTDTAALDEWIQNWEIRQAPHYDFNGLNCAAFCIAGLMKGGAIGAGKLGWGVLIPNRLFMILSRFADENWTWQGRQPNPEGEVRRHETVPCLKNRDGSCVN